MIELGRNYRTRDGHEVRIYAVDGGGYFAVHGAIKNPEGWCVEMWCANGDAMPHQKSQRDDDLIEIRPRAIDRMIAEIKKSLNCNTWGDEGDACLAAMLLIAERFKSEEDA